MINEIPDDTSVRADADTILVLMNKINELISKVNYQEKQIRGLQQGQNELAEYHN